MTSFSFDAPRRKRALFTGKMSVGKSSLVNALWGRPDMLPTASRDCTQTNTLIRPPDGWTPSVTENLASDGGKLHIRYLPFARACKYALGSAHWHRIAEFVKDTLGPTGPKLDELPPAAAIPAGLTAVRDVFKKKPSQAILHEELQDSLETLGDMLSLETQLSGVTQAVVEKNYAERSEYLMGKRRPDGSVAGEGFLLAQEWVELHLAPLGWQGKVPELLDTPMIPTLHDTRRADLILNAAESADVIALVTLPRALVLEDWLLEFLKRHPQRADRVMVVMNQIDTVDETSLFGREGFTDAFEASRETMRKLDMDPNRIVLTASWMAFLKQSIQTPEVAERAKKLESVLAKLKEKAAPGRVPEALSRSLAYACDPNDAGVVHLRNELAK